MALRLLRTSNTVRILGQVRYMSGGDSQQPGWGSGAGHGGGSGGSVRDAGGSFGKREAAFEEQYFRKLQQEQLKTLKDSLTDEISYHHEQIKEHQSAKQLDALHEHHHEEVARLQDTIKKGQEDIERHKKKLAQLKHLEKHDD